MIQLAVKHGDEPTKTFHIHKSLLCDLSKYFKNAVDGNFNESGKDSFTLQDGVSERTVASFISWAYTGALSAVSPTDHSMQIAGIDVDDDPSCGDYSHNLCQLGRHLSAAGRLSS
jgi:hypothetical protein